MTIHLMVLDPPPVYVAAYLWVRPGRKGSTILDQPKFIRLSRRGDEWIGDASGKVYKHIQLWADSMPFDYRYPQEIEAFKVLYGHMAGYPVNDH